MLDALHKKQFQVVLALTLIGSILVMLYLNWLSQLSVPVPDSSVYFPGDESWLLSEYKAMILTGRFYHPYAQASTLSQGCGLIFGNMWITSALYGIPQLLFHADPIEIGRIVTMVIALVTLIGIYRILRNEGLDAFWSASALILFLSTPCFLVMSHSARYDMLVGLSNLLVIAGLVYLLRHNANRLLQFSMFGLLEVLLIAINPHIALQTSLCCIFVLWKLEVFHSMKKVSAYIAGVGTAIIVFLCSEFAQWDTITLFGPKPATPSIYVSFFGSIPILHPFEFQRQLVNITGRFSSLLDFAPLYLFMTMAAIIYLIFDGRTRRDIFSKKYNIWMILGFLLIAANLLFENRDEKYLIHVLPVITVCIFIIPIPSLQKKRIGSLFLFALAILATALSFRWSLPAMRAGGQIVQSQNRVFKEVEQKVKSDDPGKVPNVLFFPPAIHAAWNGCTPIATMFLKLPSATLSPSQTLEKIKADYAVAYTYSLIEDDVLEEHPINRALNSIGTPIERWIGTHTDYSTVYGEGVTWGVDTLTLYRIDSNRSTTEKH